MGIIEKNFTMYFKESRVPKIVLSFMKNVGGL
jgi:hypothetical protein